MYRVCILSCLLIAAVLLPSEQAAAWFQVNLRPGAYDPDAPSLIETLEGEDPEQTRIASDAARIAAAAGAEAGPKIDELIRKLFDSAVSDSDRLSVSAELRKLAAALDMTKAEMRSLRSQIERRCRLVEMGLKALQEGAGNEEARKLVHELLVRATVDYENSNRAAHSEVVRRNYALLRTHHLAVFNRINQTLLEDYMNYNLHFVMSETLLSKMVSDCRSESGGVADCILGAWVTGNQVTDTFIRADIKPSVGRARFDLLVDGRTFSNTQGRKKPATVYTHGNHTFFISKATYFDGQYITSSPAHMNVNPDNRTVGLSTDFDRIPIIRGIVRNMAWKQIQEKHGQSEAIAAQKMIERALPQLESEVGKKYSEANQNIQTKVLQNLRDRNIAPQSYSARSSDSHFAFSSRTMNSGNLAAPRAPYVPAPQAGLAVQMHESAINASIDSLGLKGEMTPSEVVSRIEMALGDLLDRTVSLRDAEAEKDDKTNFVFADADPVRVRFDEGKVIFILRTGFHQLEKDRTVPKHIFEIPVGIEMKDGKLYVVAPETDVRGILALRPKAIEKGGNVAQARAVAKELLDKTFKKPRTEFDANVDVELANNRSLQWRVTDFEITDGWITAILQ